MSPPADDPAPGRTIATEAVVAPPNPAGKDVPDAGLRSLDHYKKALPRWRYWMRQKLLPLIRWETPYLAYFQTSLRTPALDSYFAITANLGTHTFYMIFLPILFWCGYASYGKGLVHILAEGVFFTGFIKDMLSLPRPLSPPLHRITMTGYAALEYGFPSTHSANAVSVVVYVLLNLHSPDNTMPDNTKTLIEGLSYFYAFSIVIGRLYCGMHGFLDVIIGSILGTVIGLVEFYYGPTLDLYMHSSSWIAPVVAALLIIALVRVHPEPADDCPCFDDSVAFAGVVIGLEIGTWTYGKTPWDPFDGHAYGYHSIDVNDLSWPVRIARMLFGVVVVFAWRELTKPALLRFLPHVFRIIERPGLILPRRFFKSASQYDSVSPSLRIDTLFPAASDFPKAVDSFRHKGTRGRSVSIGPQSAADAYETLAYRERRRRESVGSNASVKSKPSLDDIRSGAAVVDGDTGVSSGAQSGDRLKRYENMMGEGDVRVSPTNEEGEVDAYVRREMNGLEEKEVFARLVKSRVRYDVEVVTKLVVYTGIAWLSVALIPIMFEFVGLGATHLRA